MKTGVIVFPGSNCDADCYYVVNDILQQEVRYVWHTETDLSDLDCVILPGGFSYGDYLRPGAIASHSPVIKYLKPFADEGKYIIGICNGFQVLTETHLLPGALIQNNTTRFICKNVELRVENVKTPFTNLYKTDQIITVPIAHNEGRYYADDDTIQRLIDNEQIVFTYVDNPNGSSYNIAGIINEQRNILGMMPHPERCSDHILGLTDGLTLFYSLIK